MLPKLAPQVYQIRSLGQMKVELIQIFFVAFILLVPVQFEYEQTKCSSLVIFSEKHTADSVVECKQIFIVSNTCFLVCSLLLKASECGKLDYF